MKISPETWQSLEPLLETALEMDQAARDAWLFSLEATDAELLPLLRQLLATHDRAEQSGALETVPQLASAPRATSQFPEGAQVGPFRLLRSIGRGGMGEVWLAQQLDGRVERQVALKLPTVYQLTDVTRERFRRERDILAKLNHPNIAKLHDAGVSDVEGSRDQPYLALEFVEGESLLEHADKRRLTIAQRLALFRQILAAVAHAHRHLVVHRDLKPANILIDGAGQVKLLDFGIAKLIDDETQAGAAAALTQMGGRIMTLRYAAPEQVAAGTISTSTDVYALGVTLHELVSGCSPYRAVREGKPLTESVLLAEQIEVPSSLGLAETAAAVRGLANGKQLTHALTGDLDAIILKALRRNPVDRYATIEQLDADILRHLEHRPVEARQGTWRYLAGRFAARHKLPIAAAAVVLLTTSLGLVMVEQQRRVAVAEKARAEKHFASVRKLANSFMFDLQGELESVPGALKARQKLVATSREYLDNLSAEAGDDAGLALELSTAYRKLAQLQGANSSENAGQDRAAMDNAKKARALLQPIVVAQPYRLDALRELIAVERSLSLSLWKLGDKAALPEAEMLIELAHRALTLRDATNDDKRLLGVGYLDLGRVHAYLFNDFPTALTKIATGLDILEVLAREAPTDFQNRIALASGYAAEAFLLGLHEPGKEQLTRSMARYQQAQALFTSVLADQPDNSRAKLATCIVLSQTALVHEGLGDPTAAIGALRGGITCASEFASRDAASFAGLEVLAEAQSKLALLLERLARPAESLAMANDALATISRLPPDVQTGFNGTNYKVFANEAIGRVKCFAPSSNVATRREGRMLIVERLARAQEVVDRKLGSLEANPVQKMQKVLADCDAAIARASK